MGLDLENMKVIGVIKDDSDGNIHSVPLKMSLSQVAPGKKVTFFWDTAY